MDTIGIVGAGTMGNGIAYVAASHGHDVVMYDVQLTLAQRGFEAIRATLQRHVEKKRIDQAEMQATLDRVRLTTDLGDMARAVLVIEAVPEDLALKRDIFHSLDHICDPAALLCSNTSSLSITALAGATRRPDQVAGLHFFNPAPMMALIEVVKGDRTSEATHRFPGRSGAALGQDPDRHTRHAGLHRQSRRAPVLRRSAAPARSSGRRRGNDRSGDEGRRLQDGTV